MTNHFTVTLRKVSCLALAFCSLALLGLFRLAAADDSPGDSGGRPLAALAFSQIQTGGCTDNAGSCTEDPAKEFVELFNTSPSTLDVTGWKLQYLSASGSTVTTLAELDGTVKGRAYALASLTGDIPFINPVAGGKLARSGGMLRLIDRHGTVTDLVGWGTAATPAPWQTLAAPKPAQSIRRPHISSWPAVQDYQRFSPPEASGPAQGGGYSRSPITGPELPPAPAIPAVPDPLPSTPDNQPAIQTEPLPSPAAEPLPGDGPTASPPTDEVPLPDSHEPCAMLQISELLPNPAGSDTGQEFIELFNPTKKAVQLKGCSLQTSNADKKYILPEGVLAAGAYRAFDNEATGLTLPNSGGWAKLFAGNNDTLQEIIYDGTMEDDEAWALHEGIWSRTKPPTPDSGPVAPPVDQPDTAVTSEPPAATPAAPCPTGQERNPATNRCRVIPAPAAETACKVGQERNPETGRCRAMAAVAAGTLPASCKSGEIRNPSTNRRNKIAASAKPATACKPDQVRNPDTGRCKAAPAAKKACPAGQIRNQATGRCKKDPSLHTSAATVKDVRGDEQAGGTIQWRLLGLALLIALLYGVYEWRQELRHKISGWFGRFSNKRSPSLST